LNLRVAAIPRAVAWSRPTARRHARVERRGGERVDQIREQGDPASAAQSRLTAVVRLNAGWPRCGGEIMRASMALVENQLWPGPTR